VSDTPYRKIISSLATLAKMPCDDDEHIRRSPVMDEVVRIRAAADYLERENADLRANLEKARRNAGRYIFLMHSCKQKRIWNHVLDDEVKEGHDSIESAIDAAIAKEKP
jgi:DNA-binding transcriptional LysR family regulator